MIAKVERTRTVVESKIASQIALEIESEIESEIGSGWVESPVPSSCIRSSA